MKWATINFILGIVLQIAIWGVYHMVSFESAVVGGIALLISFTLTPPLRDKE